MEVVRTVVAPPLSVVECLWGVFVWGCGVLFLSCVCVSGVLFSVGVCVCDVLICLALSARLFLGCWKLLRRAWRHASVDGHRGGCPSWIHYIRRAAREDTAR